MKSKQSKLLIFFITALVLCGCGNTPDSSGTNLNPDTAADDTAAGTEAASSADFAENDSEMFTDRDYETDFEESKCVRITLNGDSISCDSDTAVIFGTTIQLTEEASYLISGTLNDGRIVVDAADTAKLQIILNGASITSETSAPLYILEADKVFLTLADNTDNTLANGGTFAAIDDNNIDAAVFSKQDLTFNGSGSLTVTSPAGHGIVSKDDLVFTGGTYTLQSSSHALDANDSVRVTNASITANAGKDGIHAENADDTSLGFVYISDGTFHIEAQGDGISAASYLQINDGDFQINAGGGSKNSTRSSSESYGGFMGGSKPSGKPDGDMPRGRSDSQPPASSITTTEEDSTSMKALKSAGNMQIAGGTFSIDSADDAVHTNASAAITAGSFQIAAGDDAVHADETLTISDGTITISESYEGLEALDVQISGGDITLTAHDDGVNAAGGTDSSGMGGRDNGSFQGGMGESGRNSFSNGSIVISGGTLNIQASGDGIDANGTLEITGGFITVCGPVQGDTATLDYDTSGVISGGTFVGTGASSMAQTFSDSNQGVISVSVGNQPAGTTIVLTDSSGNTILTHEPQLPFEIVILSSPELVTGEVYTVSAGTFSEESKAN